MAETARKPKTEYATIDCAMVTIETPGTGGTPDIFGFTTGTTVAVETQTEVTDAVKLIIKGQLKAQKKEITTITGQQLTLTDNVFTADLVLVMQGGEILFDDQDPTKVVGYNPPTIAEGISGEIFKTHVYSSIYDEAGLIQGYEKTSYPNCTGNPISFTVTDGEFRAPEYVINSAAAANERPYEIRIVDALPTLS